MRTTCGSNDAHFSTVCICPKQSKKHNTSDAPDLQSADFCLGAPKLSLPLAVCNACLLQSPVLSIRLLHSEVKAHAWQCVMRGPLATDQDLQSRAASAEENRINVPLSLSHKLPVKVIQPTSAHSIGWYRPQHGHGHETGQVRGTHAGRTAAPSSRAYLLQSDRPSLLHRKLLLQAGHLLLQLNSSRALQLLLRGCCLAALVLLLEGLVLSEELGQRRLTALKPASQLTQLLQRGGCTESAAQLLREGRVRSVCRLLPAGPASTRGESIWVVEQCSRKP